MVIKIEIFSTFLLTLSFLEENIGNSEFDCEINKVVDKKFISTKNQTQIFFEPLILKEVH
jgi:hypothetical protein